MKISPCVRALLCLLAAFLLLTCGTVACKPQPTTPPDNTPPTDGQKPPVDQPTDKEVLDLITQGITDYTLIRADAASVEVRQALVNLSGAILDLTGCTIKPGTDWVDRGESAPVDTPEILIGLTNRPESIEAHAALKETEYTIAAVGNRLVIVGYDDACTVAAVTAFIEQLAQYVKTTDGGIDLSLPNDFLHNGTFVVKSYLNEFDKSSYSMYLDDKLTATEETLLYFESFDGFEYKDATEVEGYVDDGIGFVCEKDNKHWSLINTPLDAFSIDVTNKFTQTVKMWVYVNDIDLLGCDHDAVYGTPQVGSGTLYITLYDENGKGHTWQHTFAGSGWHEIELSFACHNIAYPELSKIDYSNLCRMAIWCIGYKGLEIRFDDMRLCTYENKGYVQTEAPNGGRWLSTCDYEALDGPILTEWYGSYFDLEDKTQGSSSIAITGHKENVDHRVCIGVNDVPVSYKEDTLCFDMYISDLSRLGTNWQIRLEHNAQAGFYFVNYDIMKNCAVDENGNAVPLKSGAWNHIQLPLSKTALNIGSGYETVLTEDLVLTQLMFFIEGTGATEKENYLIKYDNFYVTKTANLKAANN